MKRYKITLPTRERCIALGVNGTNLSVRTQMWLMGVASGVAYCGGKDRFNLFLVGNTSFDVETNSDKILFNVRNHLEELGCTVTPAASPIPIPNCPACNGERELSGVPGNYVCFFCGVTSK